MKDDYRRLPDFRLDKALALELSTLGLFFYTDMVHGKDSNVRRMIEDFTDCVKYSIETLEFINGWSAIISFANPIGEADMTLHGLCEEQIRIFGAFEHENMAEE